MKMQSLERSEKTQPNICFRLETHRTVIYQSHPNLHAYPNQKGKMNQSLLSRYKKEINSFGKIFSCTCRHKYHNAVQILCGKLSLTASFLRTTLGGQLGGSRSWSTGVQDDQDDGDNSTGSDGLGRARVAATVLADLKAHISGERVNLLGTELVVAETSQGDGVTEELQGSDGVTEDEHGGGDQQDILQDTGHGQDNSGGLADLSRGFELAIASIGGFDGLCWGFLTRRTTEAFSRKATRALATRVMIPRP